MNESLIKADVFFFVATISLVVLTFLLMVGLIYVVSILRTIKKISRAAQAGTESVVEGIAEAKSELSKSGYVPEAIYSIFKRLYSKGAKRKK